MGSCFGVPMEPSWPQTPSPTSSPAAPKAALQQAQQAPGQQRLLASEEGALRHIHVTIAGRPMTVHEALNKLRLAVGEPNARLSGKACKHAAADSLLGTAVVQCALAQGASRCPTVCCCLLSLLQLCAIPGTTSVRSLTVHTHTSWGITPYSRCVMAIQHMLQVQPSPRPPTPLHGDSTQRCMVEEQAVVLWRAGSLPSRLRAHARRPSAPTCVCVLVPMQVLIPENMQRVIEAKRDMDAEAADGAPSTPRQSSGGGRPAGFHSPRGERLAHLSKESL
jgi:hypothetical protein